MNMKILILTDGYHTSTCLTNHGARLHGVMELIDLLAQPHQTKFEVKVIGYEETDNYDAYGRLDAGNFSEEDFNLLWGEAKSDCHWRI